MNIYLNVILVILFLASISGIFTFKFFQKAGRKSWEAFIPFYNQYIILKHIIHRPTWWIVLNLIPIIGPIISIVTLYDLLAHFKHSKYIHTLLAVITFGFYLLYVSFKKEAVYVEDYRQRKETFVSSVLFAVVLATLVHTYAVQPYTIPTSSMEKTLMVGDFLFVSKATFGTRIPFTPVAIPFIHSVLSGNPARPKTVIKSYIDKIRLPYIRLPKFREVKNNDIVVFNYPADSVHTAVDRKDNYIKRCVALPGDKLEVKAGKLFINNQAVVLPKDNQLQFSYLISSPKALDLSKIYDLGIKDFAPRNQDSRSFDAYYSRELGLDNVEYVYNIALTEQEVKNMKFWYPSVNKVVKNIQKPTTKVNAHSGIFPKNKAWNMDNYGPLSIPKKGQTISLNKENIETYRAIITKHEKNTLEENEKGFVINGMSTDKYTLKQDYYFMMGDNRHRSLDSRYWGFVPENHLIGTPFWIWMSVDWNQANPTNFSEWKFRKDRIMTGVNLDNPNKKSYRWYALALIIAYFVGSHFYNKNKEKRKEKK